MSISGPCAWLSSLPPPSTSHLSAITNHWQTTGSWNAEPISPKARVLPSRSPRSWEKEDPAGKRLPVDMQPAGLKAENAFPAAAPAPTGASGSSATYAGAELRGNPSEHRTAEASNDTSLSRMRLDKLNHSEPVLSAARPQTPQPENTKREVESRENEKDVGEVIASSDEGTASPGKRPLDSKNDKKKMKRFRLTHNQTRFLMSEFTRQAHPDAAHRERLSREIPGLTPRQVQVWFQNRRAKLKRLTSNDRERMLKSRALPDDFDTTQVLRTPFDGKGPEAPMLLTDGLPRLNDDDYVISPLSSASTTGNGFSAGADRNLEGYAAGTVGRGPPGPMSTLQRNRNAFPFPRSSSFSEPSYNTGLHFPGRFSRPGEPLAHPGLPYGRRPMDYMSRPGMVVGYEQPRQMEGSVSPTGAPEQAMSYMDGHNQPVHSYQSPLTMPAPKGYGLEMSSHMQPGRHIPALQSLPVSEAAEYRPYSYEHHPYSMNTALPYTQANASSMSLPASFPSDTSNVTHGTTSAADERMNNPPAVMGDALRAKYGPQFEYANYL
ncbi:predicted protein [Aspergillus terreus NIH2624]|uniref:Homeobox domain-containing protein n=1 Tax=Aspergillus terreus (strain NIH 2624 / FGSC A1156) TaxID=341663 RepID=Q0CUA7_ASPTN|nr:uncharacterized protein ATEG_02727 [Aspergillus terreus NIH2624]EAU37689.1 predicted protein [Aspergillus terreus NIH2624]